MATILEASKGGDAAGRRRHWRDEMMVARFRTAEFHVDSAGRENGRRVVVHEFPKKELCYSEDMGRRAIAFNVRGYCIVYPFDNDQLFQRDYRVPRDRLITALEQEGRGVLQLPTLPPMAVVCERYRLMEESKTGGYCVFEMQFSEYGHPPSLEKVNSGVELRIKADAMRRATERRMIAIQRARRVLTARP